MPALLFWILYYKTSTWLNYDLTDFWSLLGKVLVKPILATSFLKNVLRYHFWRELPKETHFKCGSSHSLKPVKSLPFFTLKLEKKNLLQLRYITFWHKHLGITSRFWPSILRGCVAKICTMVSHHLPHLRMMWRLLWIQLLGSCASIKDPVDIWWHTSATSLDKLISHWDLVQHGEYTLYRHHRP